MSYIIEDNVPAPAKVARGRPCKYPILDLLPGQSFLACENSDDKVIASLRSQMHRARKVTGGEFVAAKTDIGFRVWRTA